MGVRFIIGRAGAGKTRHCFEAIVEAMAKEPLGAPIYWLLPKQATFSAERELTCNSGLRGFCRCRVVSFDQLGRDVLEECRGGAVPEITPLGRQMLLGHLLRKFQPQLKFFTGVARQPGLAARLDSTFTEFDRCGQGPESLETILSGLRTSGSDDVEQRLLINKLADFHLLYRAYHDFLGQERVDPHRRLDQVLACVQESKRLCGARVYVDGFLEFTDTERKMLAAMANVAERVEITLLADPASRTIGDVHHLPDEFGLFYRLEETYRRLIHTFNESAVKIERPMILADVRRFANPSLTIIEKRLFEAKAKPATDATNLEMIEAPDRRGEVNAVARRIGDLLRQGLRLRDIAVLVRDLDEYHELIGAAFRDHGIRFFADRRRTAGHHPLLQFTRSIFQVARGGWPHDAMISLIKSGLADLDPNDADELENYVLLHRIRGTAWASDESWTYARTIRREEDDEPLTIEREHAVRMDRVRRELVARIAPFVQQVQQPATVREIVAALFELYESFDVRAELAKWIDDTTKANQLEQRGEHEQVWAEVVELFDQMIDLLGPQTVELADFVETLEAGLEQFDLALTPPTVDQVLVGQVDRTRASESVAVFVLGLGDGQFPRVAREDSVLSDSERRSLQKQKLNVEPDSQRRLLDENLYGYIAFTRARNQLVVTRPIADESNRPLAASAFWQRLRELFPTIAVTTERRESESVPEDIATPRQLVTGLMRWARQGEGEAPAEPRISPSPGTLADPERSRWAGEGRGEGDFGSAGASPSQRDPWPALYQWLATHEFGDDAIDMMRFRSWKALSYHNRAALSPEIAAQLFKSPLRSSVTRVESFATCPFKHFAQYGLGLREREEADVTAMDLGNVYHQVLERLVRECLSKRQDWCKIEPHVTDELIKSYAREVGQSLRGELMLSTARNQYLLKRIEKTLGQVVATQREVLKRGGFRPAWAELAFGRDGKLPAYEVKTPHGNAIELHGKIDRVDLIEEEAAFAVIDYKLSGRPLALHRVYHGISLQLLTYLLVLQRSGKELHGKKLTPVAAFYAQLLRSLESVQHPEEAKDPAEADFSLKIKPRGIFDGHYVNKIDAELTSGKSNVIAAYIKNDNDFGFRDSSDVASTDEFAALLRFVESKIAQLADQIIEGNIDIRPYRIGRQSPCPWCEFRAVCRFDVTVNGYHPLAAMKRTEVLAQVLKEAGDGR